MRVLVVDDDELSRDLVRAMLERLGAQTTLAASAAAGLEELHGRAFDVLLVDLKLPDLDGLELVQRMRVIPGAERIQVVVVSGAEAQEARERCRQAGCAGYLSKPFTFQEFEQVVGPLLSGQTPESNRANR
jgi:CheY-like chemotaxis protein